MPETPDDLLKDHACLYHRWSATGKLERWELSRDGVELDLDPPAATVASTIEPLIDLCERGLGLLYTPTFTVRRQIEAGTLRSVLDPYVGGTATVQILWPPSRHLAPKVKAFVDFMAQHLLTDR